MRNALIAVAVVVVVAGLVWLNLKARRWSKLTPDERAELEEQLQIW